MTWFTAKWVSQLSELCSLGSAQKYIGHTERYSAECAQTIYSFVNKNHSGDRRKKKRKCAAHFCWERAMLLRHRHRVYIITQNMFYSGLVLVDMNTECNMQLAKINKINSCRCQASRVCAGQRCEWDGYCCPITFLARTQHPSCTSAFYIILFSRNCSVISQLGSVLKLTFRSTTIKFCSSPASIEWWKLQLQWMDERGKKRRIL